MEGRISTLLWAVPFGLLCAGCVTTQPQKNVTTPSASTNLTRIDSPPKVKKDDGPKRNPLPSTEVAFGKMKEAEADSDMGKKNPEAQARLRDDARTAYQQALKIDPNHLDATRHLGKLYAKIGDFERAQEVYKKALAKHPKDATLWFELAQCHNRRKDFAESLRCFHKSLELDPENRECMKKIGFTYAWMGQPEQGLSYLTRAHGAALAHYNIARIHLQRDQREPAEHHLRIALRENSNLQEARDLLTSLENPEANPVQRAGG